MPQRKTKKAAKPKKKTLSIDDEDEVKETSVAENPDDADEETVEKEPGIEEIAKMTVEVVEISDADLDNIDLSAETSPEDSEK